MSLTKGLENPRTPLRLFLDRELSAGVKPLRETFHAQLFAGRSAGAFLFPEPGVGSEAGAAGTAVDLRLRLAFTSSAPVDGATALGVMLCGGRTGAQLGAVGRELLRRLTVTVRELRLDDRCLPMCRAREVEEELARLLLAAAWYAVAMRNPFAFDRTPLLLAAREAPDDFTLEGLLALPHRDLVADVTAQVRRAAEGDLAALRARTAAEQCVPGPTFPGAGITSDADLVVDGLLLDFKSNRSGVDLPQQTVHQLVGYLLLDREDRYRISRAGLYLTRSGRLVSWPVEEMLTLLGTRRRDLGLLRAAFAQLLEGCTADNVPAGATEEERVQRLLERVDAVLSERGCPVCAQPLPAAAPDGRVLVYCSGRCARRAPFLSRRGWLLTPAPVGKARPEQITEAPVAEESPIQERTGQEVAVAPRGLLARLRRRWKRR